MGKVHKGNVAGSGYARPELLAEPDWIWERREDPSVRVIDCGGSGNACTLEAYGRAHIPGAVGLPEHNWIKDAPAKMFVMAPGAFAELTSKLGVSDDTTVVVYDHACGAFAARLWWVLHYYGHSNAKLLNGGWQRWVSEGRPIRVLGVRAGGPPGREAAELDFSEAPLPRVHFVARPNEAIICRLDDLKAKLGQSSVQVLDLRSEGEWAGEANPFGNKRLGHVPGAANIEWLSFITEDGHCTFKPSDEMKSILAQRGISPGSEVITYCQAGSRSAHGAFVLYLLGWEHVRLYDASMAEWANRSDTPLLEGR